MRMKLLLGLVLVILCSFQIQTFAQDNVGIGTTNPRVTAILDLFSNNQGLLLPRVDTTNMTLSGPDNGMVVYDTVVGDIYVWNGTQFISLTNSLSADTARWGVNGNDIYSLNSGNVGIGTTTPTSPLTIETSGANEIGFSGVTDANINAPFALNLSGGTIGLQSSTTNINAGTNNLAVDIVGVAIGSSTISNSNASLTLTDNDKGLGLNKVDTASFTGLSAVDAGLLVYDTTDNQLYVWDGTRFEAAGSSGAIDTLPANVFSARIANNGAAASILSQSYPFIQSVLRTGLGSVNVTFVPGFFNETPSASISVNDVAGPVDASAVNVTSIGFTAVTGQTGAAGSDWDFSIVVQRQGADYQNTLTAPPNVVGFWEVNGTDIYHDTSFVGIGINTPLSRLHVENDVLTNESVGRFINTNTGNQDGAAIYATSTSTAANWGYGVRAEGNYLGVDAVSSSGGFAGVRAQSGGALYGIEILGDAASTAGLHLDANGATYGAIFENGRVGIGTTAPGEMLHVQADSNNGFVSIVAENTNANGLSSFDLVNDVNRMEWRLEGSSLGGEYFLYDDNAGVGRIVVDPAGNVGIGDWSPDTQFDVTDSLPAAFVSLEIENKHSTGSAALNLWNDNTAYAIGIDGSSAGSNLDDEFYIFNSPAGEFSLVIDEVGNVGIGNVVDPLVQLHVDGDGIFNGFLGLNNLGVAPGVTNNRLYNVGGNLFWDGNQLLTAADTAIWASDGVDIWNKTISGGIGIGTASPNGFYSVTVGNTARQGALRVDNDYSGASAKYGLFSDVNASGTAAKFGYYANVIGTSAGSNDVTGTHNQINPNSMTGTVYGTRTNITASGTGIRYGAYMDVYGAAGNSSSIFGTRNGVIHDGSGTVFGSAVATGGASNGTIYGNFTNIGGTGSGGHYGYYAQMSNSGSGTQYGLYVNNTASGSGTEYGVFTIGEDFNYFQGRVGINNVAPVNNLDVDGSMVIGGNYAGNNVAPVSGLLVEGNVGIGTTAANAPLTFRAVQANRKVVLLEGANNDHQFFGFGVGPGAILRYQVNGSSADHVFYNGDNSTTSIELARITGDGYLGIGESNPQERLHITGGTIRLGDLAGNGRQMLTINNNGDVGYTTLSDSVFWEANGTDIFNRNSGNVGIGINTPGQKLHVADAGATGILVEAGANSFLSLDAGTNTNSSNVNFRVAGSTVGRLRYSHNAIATSEQMEFYVNGANRMLLDGNGNLAIGINPLSSVRFYNYIEPANTTIPTGISNSNYYNGASTKYGIVNFLSSDGTGTRYGTYNTVLSTSDLAYGTYNNITPGTDEVWGVFNNISNAGTSGERVGVQSNVNGNTSNVFSIFGTRNIVTHQGTGIVYGSYNDVNKSSGISGSVYGNYVITDNDGTGSSYMYYGNDIGGGAGTHYGLYLTGEDINYLSGRTGLGTASPGTGYQLTVQSNLLGGTYIDNTYTGASTQYGIFLNSSNVGTGLKYGYYLNLDGTAGDASSIYGERLIIDPFGTGQAFGSQVQISAQGTGIRYGYFSNMFNAAGNGSSVYGLRSDIDQDGSGAAYGVYSRLDGSGTGTTYGAFINNLNAGTGDWGIYTTGEERNYMSGVLGLGTTNPTTNYQLHVVGGTADVRSIHSQNTYTGASSHYGLFSWMSGGGSGTAYALYLSSSSSTTGIEYGVYESGADRNYFSGNVGIGTSAPDKVLDVLDNVSGTMVDIRNTNTGTNADGLNIQLGAENSSNDFIYFTGSAGAYRGRIAHTGAGGVQYLSASDRRLKENIKDYHGGLGVVLAMKPKTYNFIGKDRSQTGFIAQELQEVFPDAVNGDSTTSVEEDPMMVDYAKLTPVLTNSVQELHEIIMKQQKLIDSQKEEISGLKSSQADVQVQLDALNAQIQSIIGTNDLGAKKEKD